MLIPSYIRRDYFRLRLPKKEKRDMRLGKQDEQRIIVTVKSARRARPGEKNEKGKLLKANSMIYETFDSLDVYEAGAEEVMKAVTNGLANAARNAK
jgi:hypothetical protein